MNKSLLPLIIFFALVILLTFVLINVDFQAMRGNGEDIYMHPFRISPHGTRLAEQRQPNYLPNGSVLLGQQDMEEMISDALEAIEFNRIDVAEDKIRTVLVFAPRKMQALTILGRILFAQKRYLEAEMIFRRQLTIKPGNATVLNNLASSLALQDKLAEATNYAAQAYRIDPECPEIIINLSGLYAKSGLQVRALQLFRKAHRLLGPGIIPLSRDKCFDHIRSNPKFVEIIQQAVRELHRKENIMREASSK